MTRSSNSFSCGESLASAVYRKEYGYTNEKIKYSYCEWQSGIKIYVGTEACRDEKLTLALVVRRLQSFMGVGHIPVLPKQIFIKLLPGLKDQL